LHQQVIEGCELKRKWLRVVSTARFGSKYTPFVINLSNAAA
jgi:hypothetical protein